jgi:hypothetical protein
MFDDVHSVVSIKVVFFGRVDASVVKKAAMTHASTGAPVLLLVVEQNSG